jgi:hypothetical protein
MEPSSKSPTSPETKQHREQLLERLSAIAAAIKESRQGLALLGLGSSGRASERLDKYSDLDFFVISRPGYKHYFLDSLSWLEKIQPIAFSYPNTADGYKLLFADGIFCEMAVFEPYELTRIPFVSARVIWQDEEINRTYPTENNIDVNSKQTRSVEWLIGEILGNLYVGLSRFHRGEKLSAARFIQNYAVDRIIDLSRSIEKPRDLHHDPFDADRRFEILFPLTASQLPHFMPGYSQSPQAAQAILAFLDTHFEVNEGMKSAILNLCAVA